MDLRAAIAVLSNGVSLNQEQSRDVFHCLMRGDASDAQIGALLMALRIKGETAEEIAGAAHAMRQMAAPFEMENCEDLVDIVGTGGDGQCDVNISTMAALVTAAAGVKIAKHGNRKISSQCGSADVLEALGVKIDAAPEVILRCVQTLGIGFLYAPNFHSATQKAAKPRQELGIRTVFNILGPLSNPARAGKYVMGVFAQDMCEPMAHALGRLGANAALVVHGVGEGGHAGSDEFSIVGPTRIAEWSKARGDVRLYSVSPEDFGRARGHSENLRGGDAAKNAAIFKRVLSGDSALHDIETAVVMTAASALWIAGKAETLSLAARLAEETLKRGAATKLLAAWVAMSNSADLASVPS